jgi:hypothetical protein
LLVFLLLFLISCKEKNNVEQQFTQPESIQIIPDKEPPFINSGAINIVNKLNIRNMRFVCASFNRRKRYDCRFTRTAQIVFNPMTGYACLFHALPAIAFGVAANAAFSFFLHDFFPPEKY